eukprot:864908-Prymnesium_polylepis.1
MRPHATPHDPTRPHATPCNPSHAAQRHTQIRQPVPNLGSAAPPNKIGLAPKEARFARLRHGAPIYMAGAARVRAGGDGGAGHRAAQYRPLCGGSLAAAA